MKVLLQTTVAALCSLLVIQAATADIGDYRYRGSPYVDYARVLHVDPILRLVRTAEPRRECWEEEVTRHRHGANHRSRSYTPMVVGGIVGGVVGNQFSQGKRRDALTVAGVLLGASIGRDLYHSRPLVREPYVTTERRCRVIDEYHVEERVEGYRVTYRYQGKTFVRRMNYDPGNRIRVRVAVSPVDD